MADGIGQGNRPDITDQHAESVAAHEVRLNQEDGHWRWRCSCGSKGIRLYYRESVERLARKHGTLIDGRSDG